MVWEKWEQPQNIQISGRYFKNESHKHKTGLLLKFTGDLAAVSCRGSKMSETRWAVSVALFWLKHRICPSKACTRCACDLVLFKALKVEKLGSAVIRKKQTSKNIWPSIYCIKLEVISITGLSWCESRSVKNI